MQYRLTIYICRSQAALEGGAELLAIYKKDIRAYFSSIYGYVITMSFYAAAGIVFVSQNILHESSDLKPLFDTLAKFMILLVPLITKNAVAFERKNGTDRIAPASTAKMITALPCFRPMKGTRCLFMPMKLFLMALEVPKAV